MLKNEVRETPIKVVSKKQISGITKLLLSMVVSFVLSGSKIAGGLSPLNVAFVGALSPQNAISAVVGSMLAYFFSGKIFSNIIQIISLFLLVSLRILFIEIKKKKISPLGNAIMTFSVMLAVGICISSALVPSFSSVLVYSCQAVLAGCFTYFTSVTLISVNENRCVNLTGIQGSSLGVVFILATAALCSLELGVFNIGRIFCVFITLIAAKKYKHIGGALCGVLSSCGIILSSPDLGKVSMLLAGAGLIAGLFSQFGTAGVAFVFICANAVGSVVVGTAPDTFNLVADIMIASICFVIIPDKAISSVLGSSAAKIKSRYGNTNELISARMEFASKTVCDVKKSVSQISQALEKRSRNIDIPNQVCENVCRKCKNNLYCWDNYYEETNDAFNKIYAYLCENNRIDIDSVPDTLSRCYKKTSLIESFNDSYIRMITENKAERKFKEMRGLLYEQFEAVESMLTEMGVSINEGSECDEELSKIARNILISYGAAVPTVSVFIDKVGRIRIEAFLSNELRVSEEVLCSKFSDEFDREFEIPLIINVDDKYKLNMWEKPVFSLDIDVKQRAAILNEPSGDSYNVYNDGKGNIYVILSDGMGRGKRAAVDSMMTSTLLVKLLKAGLGFDAAIKMINSAMLVKSNDESFATLDVIKIDMYTGAMDIYKSGAASTFISKGDRINRVESSSLPIGIINEVEIEKRNTVLKTDDIIVMTSDGVGEKDFEIVKEELLNRDNKSAEDFSESILHKIIKNNDSSKLDDTTVITVKVK